MTKIFFGGSFNPVHIGHLVIARAIAEAKGFAKVVLVPSAQPPHKAETADLAGSQQRLKMCQIVATCDYLFNVADLELNRSGPSYTLETARLLKEGEGEVAWLIGADMLQILPKWHRPMDLLQEVRFIIAQRPGYTIDWETLPPEFSVLRKDVVQAPLLEISATEIRRRVAEGKSIRYLVTPEVEQYIQEQGLYRTSRGT